jgi:hypothetical protein
MTSRSGLPISDARATPGIVNAMMARRVIRELPGRLFHNFNRFIVISLYGSKTLGLVAIEDSSFQ